MTVSSLFLPVSHWGFPGYIVLIPCVGSWLVIYAGEAGPSLAKTLLSFRPLVFIGTISYSLYLWHWPIIVFSQHLPFHFADRTDTAIIVVASIVLAFLSFEYVERPFRGSSSPFSRRQIFAFGAVASVLTASFGAAAYISHGLLERYDPQTRQLVAANLQRADDFDESCSNWKKEVHSLADIKLCTLGDQAPHKIMFWGDSHVEQLYPAIKQIYADGSLPNHGVVLAVENGCLPDPHLNNTSDGFHCDAFANFAMMRAEEADVDTVFLGFSTWWYGGKDVFCVSLNGKCQTPLSPDRLSRSFLSDLSDEIRELQRRGKHTIVCLPFPFFDRRIPELEINNAVFGRFGFLIDPRDLASTALREQVRAVAAGTGAEIFDPRASLCPRGNCITAVNGISLYKDDNHLAGSGVGLLEGDLRQLLQRQPDDAATQASHPDVQVETGSAGKGAGAQL
jgi:hypothetical protein